MSFAANEHTAMWSISCCTAHNADGILSYLSFKHMNTSSECNGFAIYFAVENVNKK